MQFSILLNELIKASETQKQALSVALSFSLSEISKYIAGARLPSVSSSQESIDKCAAYFAEVFWSSGLGGGFSELFPVLIPSRKQQDLKALLHAALQSAYALSSVEASGQPTGANQLLTRQINIAYLVETCYIAGMENELKTNAVRLGQEEQYQIRKSIIRLSKTGKSNKEIAEILDVSLRHVQNTMKMHRDGGMAAIKPRTRGRRHGAKRTLSPEQEKEIQQIVVDKTPEQLRFKECMWSRKNIAELIRSKYGMTMPESTLGVYLGRWGFSVQRPTKRAYKQDEEKVANLVELEFPGITARAKEEEAEIYIGDETGLQNQSTCLRGYASIGQTPVVRTEAKHIKINMLSAISTRGKLRFILYRDNMNADKLIDFMWRLVHDSKKKVFLILDNLRVHHAKKVSAWLEKHVGEIEVFYLSPYAPECNPVELLNSDLKRAISKRPSLRSEKELEHNVCSHLKSTQLRPGKIQGFFASPTTKCAS